MQDIIGIVGIIVTIILGIISCVVTWKVAKRSIEKKKLCYQLEIFPILLLKNRNKDLIVSYKNEELKNPCLVALDIINKGNKAVLNPPFEISCKNSLLLPAFIEDIPCGYENKWELSSESRNKVKISVEYINPNQIIRARFYADLEKNDIPQTVCPMPNVEYINIESEIRNRVINIIGEEFFSFSLSGRVSFNRTFSNLLKHINRKP